MRVTGNGKGEVNDSGGREGQTESEERDRQPDEERDRTEGEERKGLRRTQDNY